MKFSKYNIFAHWKNFHIGINLMTGKIIILLEKDYNTYLTGKIEEIRKNKELFENLNTAGFIINDSDNEFSKLIHKRNNAVFYNNNVYRLTILPTLECNFRCWYCYEKHPKGKINPETLERIKKYIEYIFDTIPMFKFHLDWFGGEPLIYFNELVYPISKHIQDLAKKRGIQFSNGMTTNGYKMDINTFVQLNEIELTGYQITLDGYKDIHDKIRFASKKTGSYDTILKNINTICSSVKGAFVTVRINYTNETIKDLHKIVDDISPENLSKINVSLQRVWQTKDMEEELTTEIEEEINLITNKNVKVGHNTYRYNKGIRCYADSVNQSVVNYDGSLFKCTARDFTNPAHSVGYIDDDGKPVWNQNYYKHFLKAPFDNQECKNCIYVPVCLGVCSQKYIESGEPFLKIHCNKENCRKTIENDLYKSLYSYIKNQVGKINKEPEMVF